MYFKIVPSKIIQRENLKREIEKKGLQIKKKLNKKAKNNEKVKEKPEELLFGKKDNKL